jgi:hypothetical protein
MDNSTEAQLSGPKIKKRFTSSSSENTSPRCEYAGTDIVEEECSQSRTSRVIMRSLPTSSLGPRQRLFALLIAIIMLLFWIKVTFFSSHGFKRAEDGFKKSDDSCSKWAVVALLSQPAKLTDTMHRIASQPNWCLVVVAVDNDYSSSTTSTSIHWITPERLEKNFDFSRENAFFRMLRSSDLKEQFSFHSSLALRRTLGYLHAISHGATSILELDESLLLEDQQAVQKIDTPNLQNTKVVSLAKSCFNPYPLLNLKGSTTVKGVPATSYLQDPLTHGEVAYELDILVGKESTSTSNYWFPNLFGGGRPFLMRPLTPHSGIIQFLPTSRTFSNHDDQHHDSLLAPPHALSPYNAQVTLYTQTAFWALLLPISIPDDWAACWRAHVAACLFRDVKDFQLVYSSIPGLQFLDHEALIQSAASSTTPSQASIDSPEEGLVALVDYLLEWKSLEVSVAKRMEQLWIDLSKQGFLQKEDVYMVQAWLGTLELDLTYVFPESRKRHHNVVLSGQFNYDLPVRNVVFWTQKWRRYFTHVHVRGPFSNESMKELESLGIPAQVVPADIGFSSPPEHFMKTLQLYKDSKDIIGVMNLHDDAFVNMTELLKGQSDGAFPSDRILFEDSRLVSGDKAKRTWKIHSSGKKFVNWKGQMFDNQESLQKTLPPWYFYDRCLPGLTHVAMNSDASSHQDAEGFMTFSNGVADFLYIPTKLTEEYAQAARLFFGFTPPVMVECAFPSIVDMLHNKTGVKVTDVLVCTNSMGNKKQTRGKPAMIRACMEDDNVYGMYHPYKLSRGFEEWSDIFNAVTEFE